MHALVVYRQRTVPSFLMPQFNSHIKLAERGRKRPATEAAKLAPRPESLSNADAKQTVGKTTPAQPTVRSDPDKSSAQNPRDATTSSRN
jgi:hypothetical protein